MERREGGRDLHLLGTSCGVGAVPGTLHRLSPLILTTALQSSQWQSWGLNPGVFPTIIFFQLCFQ